MMGLIFFDVNGKPLEYVDKVLIDYHGHVHYYDYEHDSYHKIDSAVSIRSNESSRKKYDLVISVFNMANEKIREKLDMKYRLVPLGETMAKAKKKRDRQHPTRVQIDPAHIKVIEDKQKAIDEAMASRIDPGKGSPLVSAAPAARKAATPARKTPAKKTKPPSKSENAMKKAREEAKTAKEKKQMDDVDDFMNAFTDDTNGSCPF